MSIYAGVGCGFFFLNMKYAPPAIATTASRIPIPLPLLLAGAAVVSTTGAVPNGDTPLPPPAPLNSCAARSINLLISSGGVVGVVVVVVVVVGVVGVVGFVGVSLPLPVLDGNDNCGFWAGNCVAGLVSAAGPVMVKVPGADNVCPLILLTAVDGVLSTI
jgi:hypothetical protein